MVDAFCADVSRDAAEQLFGTVKPTTTWFLVEYDRRWERKAFPASAIPDAVKAHLLALTNADPARRVTVIRQNPHYAREGVAFFVALTRPHGSVLYRFQLGRYEDMLALDIPAICTQDAAYDAHIVTEPLFAVCTHGRRDLCCARYGIPVYEDMAARGGETVWQTSHVGGHRFAANVLCLPDGIVYGRVDATVASVLVDAYWSGDLPSPERLRGRSAYARHVQAAEALLRIDQGITARDGLRLLAAGPDVEMPVRFETLADGAVHSLHLGALPAKNVLASCGDAALTPYPQYTIAQHSIETI